MVTIDTGNKGFVGSGPYSPTATFEKSLALRVDGGINAVTIAPSGRDVVMASKHGIYVVDLDDPYQPPRFLEHQTPWQVADVQYSPHLQTSTWVISTSNQNALIWNLMRNATNAIEHTLHGHNRAITDINWHPENHNLLSTASVDTTVLAWDLRDSKRPVYKTADWRASASQVKWNLKNGNILASSHGNYVSLWDMRKGTKPFIQLNGHVSDVNNVSFNPNDEFELISSSNDGTIKVWNYKDDTFTNYQKQNITTDFPVWRGRYLPFGRGICAIPLTGGSNSVYLANNNDEANSKLSSVYIFKGHNDRITDFLWRSRHSEQNIDDREFQLVTWSNDSDLRLWPIADSVYEKVNFTRKEELDHQLTSYPYKTYSKEVKSSSQKIDGHNIAYKFPREKFTTKTGLFVKKDIDHLSWLSGVRVDNDNVDNTETIDYFDDDYLDEEEDEGMYRNLGEEVAIVGKKLHKVSFEKISVSTGDIVVTLNGPWNKHKKDKLVFIRAIIHFNSNYPKGKPPSVQIEESREISNDDIHIMELELLKLAQIYIDSKQNCLEPLLLFLLGEKVETDPDTIKKARADIAEYDIMKNLGLDEEDIWNNDAIENDDMAITNDSDDDDDDGGAVSNENSSPNFKKKKFDSTPVPKGCGAVFAPGGQLICFFTSSNSNKQQQLQNKLFNGSNGGIRGYKANRVEAEKSDRDSVLSSRFDSTLLNETPKTYLESLSLKTKKEQDTKKNSNKLFMGMGNMNGEDEWDNILKNDITFRTKISVETSKNEHFEKKQTNSQSDTAVNRVMIKDYSHLIPDKKELALKYKTHGESLPLVCSHNANVAKNYGLADISTCWDIIGTMLKSRSKDAMKHQDWSYDYDGGKQFLKDVFQFFEKSHNLQMLAMLSCILVATGRPENMNTHSITPFISCDVSFEGNHIEKFGKSLTHSRDSIMRQSSIFSQSVQSNMNSSIHGSMHNGGSDQVPGLKFDVLKTDIFDNGNVYYPKTQKFVYNKLELLDKAQEKRCIAYRDQYAELLYCWGFQAERSNIMRFNVNENSDTEYLKKVDEKDMFKGLQVVGTVHSKLKNCKVCEEPVSKRSFVCNRCGCLTHAECAGIWWNAALMAGDITCPSGCGCECLALY
ncbi:hypothetical protein QEN19_001922 [Hanseniaspora menglaensis]